MNRRVTQKYKVRQKSTANAERKGKLKLGNYQTEVQVVSFALSLVGSTDRQLVRQ
jgi:hypothetical protein